MEGESFQKRKTEALTLTRNQLMNDNDSDNPSTISSMVKNLKKDRKRLSHKEKKILTQNPRPVHLLVWNSN